MLNPTSALLKTLYLRHEYEIFKLAGKIIVYSKIYTKPINTHRLGTFCERGGSHNYSLGYKTLEENS